MPEQEPQRRRVCLTPRQQYFLGVAAPTLQLLMERATLTTVALDDSSVVPTGIGAFTWAELVALTGQKRRTLQYHRQTLVQAGVLTTEDHGRAGVRFAIPAAWWAQVATEEQGSAQEVAHNAEPTAPANAQEVAREVEPSWYRHHEADYQSVAEEQEFALQDPYWSPATPVIAQKAACQTPLARARRTITPTPTLVTTVISPATPGGATNAAVLMGEENIYSSLPNSTTTSITPAVSEGQDIRGLGVTSSAPAPSAPVGAARTTPRSADPEAPLDPDQRALADDVLARFDLLARRRPGFLGDLCRPALDESVESLVRRQMTRERFEGVWDWARRGDAQGRYTAAAVLNALNKRPKDDAAVAVTGGTRRGGKGVVAQELRPEKILEAALAAGVQLERKW